MSPIPQEHRARLASYRMPAEWRPHLATYLVWPHNLETWPGKFETVPPVFAEMAAAIASFEPVRVLVDDQTRIDEVRAMIRDSARGNDSILRRVEALHLATDDSWIRDHGPIFVNRIRGGEGSAQIALDFRFNSWGRKYGSYDRDDVVPRMLAREFGCEAIEADLVLEGGSIEVNGAGTVLTTESCLLNPNRNPHLSRGEIEDYLRAYLGVTNVVWLGEGIAGDDTDGHIDDLARFVAPDTIVTVVEEDPSDVNHAPLADNLRRLRAARDQNGVPFRIETLPMPHPIIHDGARLPASYANFYIVNGGIVMPAFGCPADRIAAETLARIFPGRRVVGVVSADLVWGLGSIHCLTQQHPLA